MSWPGSKEAQKQSDAAWSAFRKKNAKLFQERKLKKKLRKLKGTEKGRKIEAKLKELRGETPKHKPKAKPDYYKYIQSAKWKKKRSQAIEHYGGKCAICKSDFNIHVHHKTYARLGRERMKDLELLCGDCHANHHEGEVEGVCDSITKRFLGMDF